MRKNSLFAWFILTAASLPSVLSAAQTTESSLPSTTTKTTTDVVSTPSSTTATKTTTDMAVSPSNPAATTTKTTTDVVSTPSGATTTTTKTTTDVVLLDGKITLRLAPGFVDQSHQDASGNNPGVVVYLFVNQPQSQVVGISEVKTVTGDSNDTSDAAFDKMAQGALSGLKTQFSQVTKTGQTATMAANHRFLRIDTRQELKGQLMNGTILATPYGGRVLTLQVLTPAQNLADHDALVSSILSSIAFH